MSQASWGEAGTPDINWRMSAALQNVPRGDDDLAVVVEGEAVGVAGRVALLCADPPQPARLTTAHAAATPTPTDFPTALVPTLPIPPIPQSYAPVRRP